MKKAVITLSTAAIVLSSSIFASPVFAERSLSDVRSERSEIKTELSKAEQEVAKIVTKINEKNAEIKQIQAAIDENNKEIKKTEKQIKTLENEIAELQEEIDYLQEKIDERDEIIKNRIASYQENGGNIQFIDVLYGAKNFTDFISRVSAVITITNADKELMLKQERDQALVIEKQDEVEQKLLDQEDLLVELEEIKKVMDEQKVELDKEKDKLKKEEKKLQNKISQLNLKDSQLARIEASLTMPAPVLSLSSSSGNGASGAEVAKVAYTGGGKSAIAAGSQFVGKTRYAFGAQNPSAGLFDCSGFVQWAYAQEGVSLPRSTSGMASVGKAVSASDLRPGDLVFFDTYKKNGHVGIYVGNGKFLGSQNSTGVAYADMSSGYWKNKFKGHVRRVK